MKLQDNAGVAKLVSQKDNQWNCIMESIFFCLKWNSLSLLAVTVSKATANYAGWLCMFPRLIIYILAKTFCMVLLHSAVSVNWRLATDLVFLRGHDCRYRSRLSQAAATLVSI